MNRSQKIIQVGGTVRSGTTMLALILGNSKDAISLGEVLHLFFPCKKKHYEKIKELSIDPRWKAILSDKAENLYKNIFNYFPEKRIIVDSSKDPIWFEKLSRASNTFQLVTYKSP